MDDAAGPLPDLDVQYRRLQPALLRHLRMSHAWLAEDIAADVWVEVAALLPRFRGDDVAFRAWVFTLARRRLIDSYRRSARRPTEPLLGDPAAASDRPEDDAVGRISAIATFAELHHLLPPDQAEVLLLRIVAGLRVDEVALITGKQAVNVRVLQHRALRRLASRLGPYLRSA